LEVDDRIVLGGPHGCSQGVDFMDGMAAEWGFAPDSGGGEVKVVNEGLGEVFSLRG
jgi:hypothetical protein